MVEIVSVYEVEDFAHWKRLWDENRTAHREGGIRRQRLHVHPTDATRFVVVRRFEDLDRARSYLASPERRERMREGRVVRCEDDLPEAASEPR